MRQRENFCVNKGPKSKEKAKSEMPGVAGEELKAKLWRRNLFKRVNVRVFYIQGNKRKQQNCNL